MAVDAAFEGLVVTGAPNLTSREKPSWHSSRTSASDSSRSTARALEISDRQRSSATLDGLGRPAKVRRTSVTSATGIPPRSDSRNDGRVAVHTFVEINSVASMAGRSTRRNFDFHTGPDDHVPVQAHQPILGPASPAVLAHFEAVREHHQKLVEEPALGAPHVHDRRGLLVMVRAGPYQMTSQFFITLKDAPMLDGRHVVFGALADGVDVFERIEAQGDAEGAPLKPVRIASCKVVESAGGTAPLFPPAENYGRVEL